MTSPAVQPLLALLAPRVGGNPTQYLFERAFAHHQLDWRYLTFEIEPDHLAEAVAGLRVLGFRGGHCDPPYQQAVMACLDRVTETAATLGAANLVLREDDALIGENTEGAAVVEAMRAAIDPAGKQAVVLGAGRAGRAVALALAAAGVSGFAIVNRTPARAEALAALVADKFGASVVAKDWIGEFVVPPEADILVHATPLGAGDAPPPIDVNSLRANMLVVDAAVCSPRSGLLDEAQRRGCKTVDGLSIFLEQTAMGFRLWTGLAPDRRVLREAAEEFLEL